MDSNALPPGVEALPEPYRGFYVSAKDGKLRLRFAERGTDLERDAREIALPRSIAVAPGRSLRETFMENWPGMPLREILARVVSASIGCETNVVRWQRGSEAELIADLGAIARVFGKARGLEIRQGTAFFYAQTGTILDPPKLLLDTWDFVPKGDYAQLAEHFTALAEELRRLEPGLFAHNRPIGCRNTDRPHHWHMPMKLFLQVLTEPPLSGDPAPEQARYDQARYTAIKAAADRHHRA